MNNPQSFGLPDTTIFSLQGVLEKHPEVEAAILYGSRALGTFRMNSDIDLTLLGNKLTLSQLFLIESQIDDLLLPYKVDLSIKHQIDNPQLLDHIDRVGVIFYQKNLS